MLDLHYHLTPPDVAGREELLRYCVSPLIPAGWNQLYREYLEQNFSQLIRPADDGK